MNRLAPLATLLTVTVLFLGYGSYAWSWIAGPVAALVIWGLDRKAREPVASAPARLREPAPVD